MKVTVRDCLELSVFKDAQVVAGTAGLNNDVRTVSVLEATVPNEIKAYADDNGAITLFLVFCAVYIYLILLNKKFDESQNGVVNLFYVACVCQAFGGIYQTAMRVGYYFMIYLIIALPNTITQNKNKQEYQTNYLLVLIAFLVFGLYSIRTSTWAMAYPYYFFWEW